LELINELSAVPYIPLKMGTTERAKNAPTWKKMYHYFEFKNEEFLKHYHERSNAEATVPYVKKQVWGFREKQDGGCTGNEVLLKVLCHDICVVIQEMFEGD
jgi:transposase